MLRDKHELVINTAKEILITLIQTPHLTKVLGVSTLSTESPKTIEDLGDRFKTLATKVAEALSDYDNG